MSVQRLRCQSSSTLLKYVTSRPNTIDIAPKLGSLTCRRTHCMHISASSQRSTKHLQQFQKEFSTSATNMSSSTNTDFLLSEVFNVKGKVNLQRFTLIVIICTDGNMLHSSPEVAVELDSWLLRPLQSTEQKYTSSAEPGRNLRPSFGPMDRASPGRSFQSRQISHQRVR